MGLAKKWLGIAGAVAALLVGVLLIALSNGAELNERGPRAGDEAPVYLFQAYDCVACWDLTVDGDLASVMAAADEVGRSIIWKNVAPQQPYAATAAHCAWQHFPDRWLEWNHAAFTEQLEPGSGWASLDSILFMTESTLLLPQHQTRVFESCLYESGLETQVAEDTAWWDHQVPLPALYVDGQWLPAAPEALHQL